MDIENALDIIVHGSNTHFDSKIVDAFMSLEACKILEVILGHQVEEQDSYILSKYRLQDLYGLYKNLDSRKFTTEEYQLIKSFNKYYNQT